MNVFRRCFTGQQRIAIENFFLSGNQYEEGHIDGNGSSLRPKCWKTNCNLQCHLFQLCVETIANRTISA